jgi:fumarate reductase flavoprotein subunit
MFYEAKTISELASKAGLPSKNLNETVTAYNLGRAENADEFNRIDMPRPIDTPPFYAIRSQGMSVSSTVGVKVDDKLRVVTSDGKYIPGLYAAGESLGTAMMGSSFCGGMLVTPALAFGKILGEGLA